MKQLWCVGLFVFLFFFGCFSPERDNPFDPGSPRYKAIATVSGKVWSYYPPFHPISDATVSVYPGTLQTTSDENGGFSFTSVPEGRVVVVATKAGFAPDSLPARVQVWEATRLEFHLDALPRFQDVHVTSSHISRWWPIDDLYLLNLSLRVLDGDGQNDLETVLVSIPSLAFLDTVQQTMNLEQYALSVDHRLFGLENLQDLLGVPIEFIARDRAGNRSESKEYFLARVIEELAVTESPRGLASVSGQPVLKWQVPSLSFQHTLRVEVHRDDAGIVSRAWFKDQIPATADSIQVEQILPSGTYFWTVSIVDSFGNSSRSKEAAFRVM